MHDSQRMMIIFKFINETDVKWTSCFIAIYPWTSWHPKNPTVVDLLATLFRK